MTDPVGDSPRDELDDVAVVDGLRIEMIRKMRANAHKAHWSTVSQSDLFNRLLDEVIEMWDSLYDGTHDDVISECADVANFAAMIADNERRFADEHSAA